MASSADLPGLPEQAALRWLAANLGPDDPSSYSAELISGGLSNLTYRVRWGDRLMVLRRPPLSDALPGAHDMHREYRVMNALAETGVPVPPMVAFCADPAALGVPFYLMGEVSGEVMRSPADTARLSADQRHALSLSLIDVLASLHAVDPESVGLADFGRHGGYAARQIRTWGTQWKRSCTRELEDMDRLLAGLADAAPTREETTIVHGDYRLDNTVIDVTEGPRVAAVLDWELATLGHPVADLATLLTYWHDADDAERANISVAAGLTDLPGFLTTDRLAERYAAKTGRDLTELAFYRALATMKLGVILEGVHRRHLDGRALGEGYGSVGPAVPLLAARGLRLLATTR